jgi:hypothetical protein
MCEQARVKTSGESWRNVSTLTGQGGWRRTDVLPQDIVERLSIGDLMLSLQFNS